ncbi:MAG: hypothetical protein LQ341_007375 [Variospora aurantia]|nr:MAG: hypothetical protein LQ341_007375 [Variospora aurantia]
MLLLFKLTHPQLLLKILETSNITVDVKTISTNWSTDPGEEAPTPRAIQERIHKIRAMTKGKGTGSFKVTGTVGNQSSPSKVTKPRASPKKMMKKNNNTKETTTAEKRKRGGGKKGAGNKNELSLLCTTGETLESCKQRLTLLFISPHSSSDADDNNNTSDASSTLDAFKTKGNGSDADDDDMLEEASSPGKKNVKAEAMDGGMMESRDEGE